MKRSTQLLVGTFVLALAGSEARASVIWRGDYSTGNTSQWSGTESVNKSDRLKVVTSPVPVGAKYSLRTLVKDGDVIYGGVRNEVIYETDRPKEGDDRYYHWQTLFPSDFKAGDYWQLFTQWHQYNDGGSPPLAIMVTGEQIKLGTNNDKYPWTTPLVRGVWLDFIIHVKWSSNSSVGGVEVWYNGKQVLQFTRLATLFPNDTVYLKQGLYRKNLITWDQIIYHSGMTVATQLSDVLPDVAPPTPEPSPSPDPSPSPRPSPSPDPSPSPSPSPDPGSGGEVPGDTTPDAGTSQTEQPGTSTEQTANVGCSMGGTPWALSLLVVAGLLIRRRSRNA